MTAQTVDVAIIGGGPSGLAAAAELKRRGLPRVVVLEREGVAGGVPRHCGHPPFGLREFGKILKGPTYARALAEMAATGGADIRLRSEVVAMESQTDHVRLTCTVPYGVTELAARRVLIATGTRESSRAARLASGERPLGVINTGALQAYACLEHMAPFRRPVIVGTELVALSAIMTCQSIGARPVAMIEEGPRPVARRGLFLYPWLKRIPVFTSTRLVDIAGHPRVSHVIVEDSNGLRRKIDCDGVIFCGKFVGEAHLVRLAGLALDPGTNGPVIDQFGRTENPLIYAAGNLLRPVETAGWSFREGQKIAGFMANDLAGGLKFTGKQSMIHAGENLRYVVPQRLAAQTGGLDVLQMRVSRPVDGVLVARDEAGKILLRKRLKALPERRILLRPETSFTASGAITLSVEE